MTSKSNIMLVGAFALVFGGVEPAFAGFWPFGKSEKAETSESKKKKEEEKSERVSILNLEQKLEADQSFAAEPFIEPTAWPQADWALPGGNPANWVGNVEYSGGLKVSWKHKVGEGAGKIGRPSAAPIVADGLIFVMDAGQNVIALKADTGREIWNYRLSPKKGRDKQSIGGGIAFGDGQVFAASGLGELVAIDAKTGTKAWSVTAESPFSGAPTVTNGRIYVSTTDSEIIAYNQKDGSVLWSYQALAEASRMFTSTNAAVVGDVVYAPFASGEVAALSALNGRRLWGDALTRSGRLTALSSINDIAGRPVVADGLVFAGSQSGVFAAINERTGTRAWSRALSTIQTPLVAGEYVFVVTIDSELACLSRVTGQARWVQQLPKFKKEKKKEGRIAWTGPLMLNGQLFVASSEGDVRLIKAETGETERTIELKSSFYIPPVVADNTIYLYAEDATLVALK